MKKNYFIKRTVLVLMTILVMLPVLTAQSRYRHVPRVKVDKTKSFEKPIITNKATIDLEPEILVTEEVKPNTLTEVATTSTSDVVISKEKISTPIKFHSVKKNQKANKDAFTERVKQEGKLLQVKDVKKTNLIGFILWFIIVLALAVVLVVLAFILLGALAFSLWYIFLIIGGAVLVLAIILLILGLI